MQIFELGAASPPIDMVTDAMSIYTALAATDVCDTAESSLKLHLVSLRDRLDRGLVRRLFGPARRICGPMG